MAKKKIVPPPPSPVRLQALSLDTKSDKTLGYNSEIIDEVGAGEEADSGVLQKHYAQKDANFFDPYEDYVDRKTLHGGQFDIEELNTIRATNQSNWEQAGHAVARVATNIVPQIISGFASMVDLPGYIDAEHAANNKIVNWAMDLKKEVDEDWFPIYEEKPGQSMSLSDPAWWMSRGSGLVESVGSFLAQGFGVGKVVSLGAKGLGSVLQGKKLYAALEAIPGVTSGANVAKRIGGATQSLVSATMLNQSEAVIEATQVFKDTYKNRIDEGWDYAKAKKAAAEAASTTMNLNRINILLNLSSATAFLKGSKYTRQLLESPSMGHALKEVVKEGSQEAVEELINHVASKAGMAKGAKKDYNFQNALNDIQSMEGLEAAFLGAIGGVAQTGGTKALQYSKYGPGSTTDESGNKISYVQDARNRYKEQQEVINELKEKGVNFTDALHSVKEHLVFQAKLENAAQKGDQKEVDNLVSQMFEVTAFKHFSAGTTQVLEDMLKAEAQKNPDEVGEEYIERAKQSVKELRSLENIFNNSEGYANMEEVYKNQASKLRAERTLPEATRLHKESQFELTKAVDSIAKEYQFEREREVLIKKNGVVVDTETKTEKVPITYSSSDLNTNTGDTEANRAVYEKFLEEIKALPSYKATEFYDTQVTSIEKAIRNIDKEFATITSPEYQKKVTSQKEEIAKVKQLEKDLLKATSISDIEKMKASTSDKDFHAAADAKIAEIKKGNAATNTKKEKDAYVQELTSRINNATDEELQTLSEEINNAEVSQSHKTNLRNAFDRRAAILNGAPVSQPVNDSDPLSAFGFTNSNPNDTKEEIDKEKASAETGVPQDLPNPKTESQDVEKQVAETATKLLQSDTTRITGEDEQGNLIFNYGRTQQAHDSAAVLNREFDQTNEAGIVTREESTDEIENLQILDPETLQPGTELVMEVDNDYEGEKYDPESTTRETKAWAPRLLELQAKATLQNMLVTQLPEYIAEVPIKVTTKDGTQVFYVHDNAWFREENIDNTPEAIAQDKANNYKIRESIVKKGKVNTTVTYKSNGHLFRSAGNVQASTSEAMPDPNLRISVCKNNSLDFTDGELLPTTLVEGREYAIVPVGPNTFLPVPLSKKPIAQEVTDSIMLVVEAHLNNDSKSPVAQAIAEEMGIDITTTAGLSEYLQHFIYLYPTEKQEGLESVLVSNALTSDRPLIAVTATGIEFGKPRTNMGSYTNADGVKVQSFAVVLSQNFKNNTQRKTNLGKLRAILESGLILSHTRLKSLQSDGKSTLVLNQEGKTSTVKYKEQVKNQTQTNLRSINIGTEEAPKYVYTIQPTIKFDVSFAKLSKAKKAITKTTKAKKVTVPKVTPVAKRTVEVKVNKPTEIKAKDLKPGDKFQYDDGEGGLRTYTVKSVTATELGMRPRKNAKTVSVKEAGYVDHIKTEEGEIIRNPNIFTGEDLSAWNVYAELAALGTDTKADIEYRKNRNKEQKNEGAPVLDGYNNAWFAYYTPEGPENKVSFKTQQEALNWIDSKYNAELTDVDTNAEAVADIERRRQEELGKIEQRSFTTDKGITWTVEIREFSDNKVVVVSGEKDGDKGATYTNTYPKELSNDKIYEIENVEGFAYTNVKKVIRSGKRTDAVNAKYDAEYVDKVKKGTMTKEQAMKALEEVGRKDSSAYTELAALEQTTEQVIANSPIPSIEQEVENNVNPEDVLLENAEGVLDVYGIETVKGLLENITLGNVDEEEIVSNFGSVEGATQILQKAVDLHTERDKPKATLKFPGKKDITITGNTKDSVDISEDTFDNEDSLITPLTEEQVKAQNVEIEAMIIRGVDSETQRSLIAYLASDIIQKTLEEKEVSGSKTVNTKDIFNTNKEYFKALAQYYKENGLPNKAKRLEAIIEQYDKVQKLTQQYMALLSTGTVTSQPKTDSEESVGLEKTIYTDEWTFTIDSKATASGDLKKFFAFVQAQDANGLKENSLGLEEIMPFDVVYDTLHEILANKPADYTTMLETLKIHAERFPWINSVVESLEKAPERIQNEFVSDMAKHHIEMSFIMWEKDKSGNYNLQRWSSNSASKENRLRAMWASNLKGLGTSSNLVVVNDDDEYVFDNTVIDTLLKQSEAWTADPSKVTNEELANWLGQLGIVIADDTYDDLRKGFYNNSGKKSFEQLFTHSQGLIKVLSSQLLKIKTHNTPVEDAKLLGDRAVQSLAKLDATNSLNTSSNSFQSGSKTVYSYGNNNYLVNRMRDLTAHNGEKFVNEQLIKHLQETSFTKDSLWLQDLVNDGQIGELTRRQLGVKKEYLSLEALKKMFTKTQDNRKLNKLTPAEHEVVKLGFFFNNSGEIINKEHRRLVSFFYPTMSDKSTMITVRALSREFKMEQGKISSETLELLYNALVTPEINRIRDKQATTVKGYEPNYFYFIPALNTKTATINGVEKTFLDWVKDKDDSIYTQEFKDAIRSEVQSLFEQVVEDKLKDWNKLGIGKTIKNDNGKVTDKHTFLDKEYMAKVARIGKDVDAVKFAAMDYVFNSLVANSESFKLFAGDPALYAKFKANKTIQENLEETFINIGKRLAGDIAPGIELANSTNNKYLQVFLKDKELNSNNVNDSVQAEYFTKIMKDYKKNYSGIEGSDAQEYTTWQEHIYVMKQLGRLTTKQFNDITEKLERQTRKAAEGKRFSEKDLLTYAELKIVMQPIKPVYVGNVANVGENVDRRVYIKSSSFPLIPELTAGLQIEKVRKALEKVEQDLGTKISTDGNPAFVRASFGTANKVGAVKNAVEVFDNDGNVKDNLEIKEENTLTLNRSNFRIQQDVPYKREKGEINVGSQEMKLLFVNLLDVQVDGDNTGAELLKTYNQAYKELYEHANEKLAERLGLISSTTVSPQLESLLEIPTTTVVSDVQALRESIKDKSPIQKITAKQKFSEENGEYTIDRVNFINKNFDKIVAALASNEQIKVLFQDENNQNKKCE